MMRPVIRRGRLLCLSLLVLLATAQKGLPDESRTRIAAEWEPAIGTLIAWPFKIPNELVVELAKDDDLFVLIAGEEAEQQAHRAIAALGVDPARLHTIPSTVQSEWTRDYGSHQVFDAGGTWRHVDPIYIDTPEFPADQPPVKKGDHIKYENAWPGDDRTNAAVAAFFEAPLDSFPGFLTGGNFLVDGHGTAFSTRALLDENLVLWSEAELRALIEKFTGVDRWVVLGNTETTGIQHIDCWLKVLDEETLLVKRAPEDHPEHARIEANLERLRELRTCYGRPYRILRIDCPRFKGNAIAAYTNALILNRKILVPLFGIPGDAKALNTYREAMPGYEVKGFLWDHWYGFDALHCRTRAIFDRRMVRLSLAPIAPRSAGSYEVRAVVQDMSRAGVIEDRLRLLWRRRGKSEWAVVPLRPAGEPDAYRAEIPAQPPGTTVEYYLEAASRSGRAETLPRTAPQGLYSFETKE
jgi:agmatine deiminase